MLTGCSAAITIWKKQLSYIQSGQKYSNQDIRDDLQKQNSASKTAKRTPVMI